MQVLRAVHLGMCFGVRDAITLALDHADAGPLTILGDLVHNPTVLSALEAKGIAVAPDVSHVKTSTVMVTAHGTSERTLARTRALGLTVVEARQPRGHGSALHVHSRDDELFYVLEGEIKLQVGDDIQVLKPGMLGFGPRGVRHSFIVTSDEARQLVMTTPAGFEDLVRSLGEPAPEARIPERAVPPDKRTLIATNAARGIEILGPPMTLD